MLLSILQELAQERSKQDEKWGEQNHPNGTGVDTLGDMLSGLIRLTPQKLCQDVFGAGQGNWAYILMKEFAETISESDTSKLRQELIQVAAVAVAWIECIDRKAGK